MNQIKWLSYWKKCLADALKSDISINKYLHFHIQNFDFKSSQIENLKEVNRLIDEVEKRINEAKGVTKKKSENWKRIEQIDILISPFRCKPIPNHQVHTIDNRIKYPFWFGAKINRQGLLSKPDEFFPLIQRRYLAPLADEKTDYIFSSVETVDKATSVSSVEIETYENYINYTCEVFKTVTNQLIKNYKTEGQQMVSDGVILLPNDDIGASKAIIELYQRIIREKAINPNFELALLDKISKLNNPEKNEPVGVEDLMKFDICYLGQMGYDFPLSISQRKALYTFYEKDQQVFAINGPPGTGKTTLLQNVVSNEMVKAAIKGGSAPVILACSNNNQAVTNIIDSFSKSNTKEGLLQGRWLPNINGCGTYLPSSRKAVEEMTGINYKKLNGDGLFNRIESDEYISETKGIYVLKASQYFNQPIENLTVVRIVEKLRDEVILNSKRIENANSKWTGYLKAENFFKTSYFNEYREISAYYENGLLNIASFEEDVKDVIDLENSISNYFDKEPFFRKIFCLLGFKFAHRSRLAQLNILLRDSLVKLPQTLEKINMFTALSLTDKKVKEARNIIKGVKEWHNWKEENNIKGNPPQTEKEYSKIIDEGTESNYFYNELDVGLRHQTFQLALHYWEGRWIQEVEALGNENRGENSVKNIWRRHAMLTPCFVSTFYMAPKFFAFSRHLGRNDVGTNIWEDGNLFNFIDLLIVDEAGQVAPEVGLATFALAKKALIVGDIKQIEPIWNITKPVDLGNLVENELIKDYYDKTYDDFYEPKGFLSSSGSIMKVAQNACDYKDKNWFEDGVALLEHRRCYNEIIAYCNKLAYENRLKPMKGNSPNNNLFKPMKLIHVDGNSVKRNNTRSNQKEAIAIVQWLTKNKNQIEQKYGKRLEEVVGIITPFRGQKFSIKHLLRNSQFEADLIKLGTVHALQGAERPIIIFSMVYAPNEVGNMFFDMGVNLLNVAVSRAKDSFIVFANKEILQNSNTPSGILKRYLVE